MRILVELLDATDSTCSHLEERLLEELQRLLGPRGFKVEHLTVTNTTKKAPGWAPAVSKDSMKLKDLEVSKF